jgi:crossover junction endodeoxyribonuclease RusA
MTTLTLPWPPSANVYWRYDRGHVHRSIVADQYRTAVGWACNAAQVSPLTGNVRVTIHLYRPAKRGDTDNFLKQLLDALQGFAYADDKQIVEIHAYRHDDKNHPRVEVEVLEVYA